MTSVPVVEMFGPTWQGEGPSLGRRAMFLRLAGCNLACRWCDTPYSWDWSRFNRADEVTRRDLDEVLAELAPHRDGTGLAVVTGGEPLIHRVLLPELTDRLLADGWDVEVETNGTLPPEGLDDRVILNVSPKLAHSEAGTVEERVRPAALAALAAHPGSRWKIVCASASDVHEASQLTTDAGVPPGNVWIMPEGRDADTLHRHLAEIAPVALAAGFNLTTRLHVLAFGDTRAT